jgi:hypothetical protein
MVLSRSSSTWPVLSYLLRPHSKKPSKKPVPLRFPLRLLRLLRGKKEKKCIQFPMIANIVGVTRLVTEEVEEAEVGP